MNAGKGVVGIVLAGGRGRRMGQGGKTRRRLGGRTLLEHAWERAARQVGLLLLSYNGDSQDLPVAAPIILRDPVAGYPGPLAGVLAGLEYLAESVPGGRWLATFACDSPWFPEDLVSRLLQVGDTDGTDVAVAVSGGRMQPVFALWSIGVLPPLRAALREGAPHGVGALIRRLRHVRVEWPAEPDPFFNINTPDELAQAERFLQEQAAKNHN